MKKHLLISITTLAIVAGSFFVFANAGPSDPVKENCYESCEPECCEDRM